jgi:NitT/TauT family transport system ATP-binding protein
MAHAVEVMRLEMAFPGRGKGPPIRVLDGVDLAVPRGQFCTIVGPSGCGKSTMLNIIAGLIPPVAGEVRIFGERSQGINRRIGYMFQKDTLLPWASALQNVKLPMEAAGRGDGRADETARSLLQLVGLRGFDQHFPRELSGGMRKRVQLARLLAQEPEIVLLDEPFGALDAQTKLILQEEFLRLWEQRRQTVMFVTHDLQEAIALGDRVILFSARPGRIKGDWTVDLPRPRRMAEVLENPRFTQLFREIWGSLREEVTLL